jgi:hypothetical protein
LAAGYLWLIGLWLIIYNHVPRSVHEASGPLRSIYELEGIVGQGAVFAAVSFIAYIVGSILLVSGSSKAGLRTDAKSISPGRFLKVRVLSRFPFRADVGYPTLQSA